MTLIHYDSTVVNDLCLIFVFRTGANDITIEGFIYTDDSLDGSRVFIFHVLKIEFSNSEFVINITSLHLKCKTLQPDRVVENRFQSHAITILREGLNKPPTDFLYIISR